MFADTHVHLDDARYEADREEVLRRAREAGVELLVSIGTNAADSRWAVEYASTREGVYAAVGQHPELVGNWKEGDLQILEELAARPKVVAIGEVGLDYHRQPHDRELQARIFRWMIRLSLRRRLPLVVHQRDASGDTLRLLREEGGGREGGVFHCFSGDGAVAEEAMQLGFDIAVGGILTFPNAAALREVVRQVPLSRLVLETDGPWLAPQPWRGQRNEPAYITAVAEKLAELKGVSVQEVARVTTQNARRLFRIPA